MGRLKNNTQNLNRGEKNAKPNKEKFEFQKFFKSQKFLNFKNFQIFFTIDRNFYL